jgi:phosphoglycerate kinase
MKRGGIIKRIGENIPFNMSILDIGPETQAKFGALIAKAKTIIWNGPVGFFENPNYRSGTDFIYYSIAHNLDANSIVGGGNTLDAISKKEYLDNITHISNGGGAMLDFIESGTLPGIEALKR